MDWPRCYMCYSRILTILHDCLHTRCIGAKIVNSWTEASTGRYVLRASESHRKTLLHTWNAVLLLSVTPLQTWKQTGKIYGWKSPVFLISKKAKVVHTVGKVIVIFVFDFHWMVYQSVSGSLLLANITWKVWINWWNISDKNNLHCIYV